jgi:hypothetical protein
VYAVGGGSPADENGLPARALMMHFDGTDWSPTELPANAPLLNWVYGFGANDVVTVGNGGTVIRYDGSHWGVQETPTTQDLWGVWGAATDDLWAVGGSGRPDGEATLLRSYGQNWTPIPIPTLTKANVNALFKVWGTASDNVWMVGQNGALLHWNGQELVEHPVETDEDLIAIWGTSADRMAIVGGRNNGVLLRWDGETFEETSLAPLPGLNGVWMRSENTIHVAGANGTLATVDFATGKVSSFDSEVYRDVHALFGDGLGVLHAVGGNFLFAASGQFEGVAVRRTLGSDE